MATKKYINPFAVFENSETKTASIKALGGAEIKYRELTVREGDAFAARMVKDFDPSKGDNQSVDIPEAQKIKYEKVALMLDVMGDATLTADYFRDLQGPARDAIDEILDLQQSVEDDALDDEGN